MGRKKSRFYADRPKQRAVDTNVSMIDPLQTASADQPPLPARRVAPAAEPKMSKRRRVQLEKYLAKKAKKDERPLLMQRLQAAALPPTIALHSTKMILVPRRNNGLKKLKERPVSPSEDDSDGDAASECETGSKERPASASVSVVPESYQDLNAAIASIRRSSMNPLLGDSSSDGEDEGEERMHAHRAAQDASYDPSSDPSCHSSSGLAGSATPVFAPTATYYSLVTRSSTIDEQRAKLPIFAEEQMIMETIRSHPVTVICGETGSGKTTQVPQFLYEAGFGDPASPNPGLVGITQPRRVAAVSVAKRVAEELGVLDRVAYHIRYETTVRAGTRVKFMTDGILLRELVEDFLLTKYSAILLDEAHERNLNTDILIGILSRVVKMRNTLALQKPGEAHPLRLVIMSATLNVDEFTSPALFSPPPPIIRVEARQHPVTVHFSRKTNPDYLAEALKMVSKIHANLPPGGILVFLTGKQEIIQLARKLNRKYGTPSCEEWAEEENSDGDGDGDPSWDAADFTDTPHGGGSGDDQDSDRDRDQSGSECELDSPESSSGTTREPLFVLPLYALLAPEEQLKVFNPPPPGTRLCVLATNVAETSLTIPNIRYVVDCGLVKQRFYDTASGAQEYDVDWISKASATQRAGRAGRVGPGHCYRLYSAAVFDQQFPPFSVPEIQRSCIDSLVLRLCSMGINRPDRFPLPSAPHPEAILASQTTLVRMSALAKLPDDSIKITPLGRIMSHLPLVPCWSRMVVVAIELGSIPTLAIALAAVLSVGDPFFDGESVDGGENGGEEPPSTATSITLTKLQLAGKPPTSDVLVWLNAFVEYYQANGQERRELCTQRRLLGKRMDEMAIQFKSLCRSVATLYPRLDLPPLSRVKRRASEQLRKLLAESLPDRLAERIKKPAAGSIPKFRRLPFPTYRLLGRRADDPASIVYLHPTSILLRTPPRFLLYSELTISGDTQYIKDVSCIEMAWLPLQAV